MSMSQKSTFSDRCMKAQPLGVCPGCRCWSCWIFWVSGKCSPQVVMPQGAGGILGENGSAKTMGISSFHTPKRSSVDSVVSNSEMLSTSYKPRVSLTLHASAKVAERRRTVPAIVLYTFLMIVGRNLISPPKLPRSHRSALAKKTPEWIADFRSYGRTKDS